ncbi:MAG: Trp family transcriptional regulator [Patescibacteria group bacterium]|nr:Trp family transcriptional regulator [Patescibacteria group bacterium]
MVRITKRGITQELNKQLVDFLLSEIKKIKTSDGLDKFMSRLLTSEEQIMFKKRLAINLFLGEKKRVRDIRKILDVSKATIGFVRRGLVNLPKKETRTEKIIAKKDSKKSAHKSRYPYPTYKGRGRWRFLDRF